MATIERQNYLEATQAHRLKNDLVVARDAHNEFFELFSEHRERLRGFEITSDPGTEDQKPQRLLITTGCGSIKITPTFIAVESRLCAAVLLTDEVFVNGEPITRKLYAVTLGGHGNWVGIDGETICSPAGRLDGNSAYKAVHKALSEKLRADTEHFESFSRA